MYRQPSIPISIRIYSYSALFDGLSVDGIYQEVRQICIWLMISVPSKAVFHFLNGQWFLECLSGDDRGGCVVAYPKKSTCYIGNHRSIIIFLWRRRPCFRSKFISLLEWNLEMEDHCKDAFPMDLSSLARIDCAVLSESDWFVQLEVRLFTKIFSNCRSTEGSSELFSLITNDCYSRCNSRTS